MTADPVKLDFTKLDGLIPAVCQDAQTGEVLMVGFMNEEAWRRTLETGHATFFSRSRNKLWIKGETSGHFQEVKEILVDCDQDTVVLKINQVGGAACHEGYKSCFFRELKKGAMTINQPRLFDPDTVYKKS